MEFVSVSEGGRVKEGGGLHQFKHLYDWVVVGEEGHGAGDLIGI